MNGFPSWSFPLTWASFRRAASWAAALALSFGSVAAGQPLAVRTLGGIQLWTDHFIYGEWRIQQNAVTGDYRLLDDRDARHAAGSLDECRKRFEELRQQRQLPALKPTVVVILHGLGRSRQSMEGLAKFLRGQSDWTTINFSYASTRKGVAEHAQALAEVIGNLEGVERVHLVGHSLGNIVVRRYLSDRGKAGGDRRPSIGRVVMLAPPNQGSATARLLKDSRLFAWVAGASSQDLGGRWQELQTDLATPTDLGIIAGSTRGGKGSNPLIPGDDDVIVGLDETKLTGARDFLVVNSAHTWIMNHDEVQEATLRFLRDGWFRSEELRHPLTDAPTPPFGD